MTYRIEKGILQYKLSNQKKFVNVFKGNSQKPRKEFIDAIRNQQITTLHESLQNNWVITNFKDPNLEAKKSWFDQRTKELTFKPSLKDKGFEYNNGIITNNEIKNNIKYFIEDTNTNYDDLIKHLGNNKDKEFYIALYDGNKLITDYDFKSSKNRFDEDIKKLKTIFYNKFIDDTDYHFIISEIKEHIKIDKKLIQYFREGEVHCFFNPIRKLFKNKIENVKSNRSKTIYNSLIIECNKLEKKYNTGMPSNKIQEIVDILKINVLIVLPFNNKLHEVSCNGKANGTIKFINWKIHHVDIQDNNDPKLISKEELNEIINKFNETNTPFVAKGHRDKVYQVSSATESYAIDTKFIEAYNNFQKENDLYKCYYDANKLKKLYEYIDNSIASPGTIDFVENLKELDTKIITHIDQEKSYASVRKCKYYNGFPCKFSDFRKTNKYQGIGIYSITNFDLTNATLEIKEIFKALNLFQRDPERNGIPTYIVCSPWLFFFDDRNIKYTIIEGAWGSSIDIEYPDYMYEKENNVSNYAKVSGIQESKTNNTKKTYLHNFHEDIINELRTYNRIRYKREFISGKEEKLPFYEEEKEKYFVFNQLPAFNKCYCEINTLMQLEKMDLSKLVRVCVDDIYTFEKDFEIVRPFRIKDDYHFGNSCGKVYINFYKEYNYIPFTNAKQEDYYKTTLALGAGGTGKSHYYLTDTGLINILFITPTHKLGRSKRKEYNCDTMCIQKLCTDKSPEFINYIKRYFNVLLIDEASMLTKETALYIMDTFKDLKIIFMGDIGFQLPPYNGTPIPTDIFDNIVEFKKNYRIKCPKLAFILNKIREMIIENKTLNEINKYVKKYLRKNGCYIKNGYKHATINDLILCSTNKEADFITEYFKGKFAPLEKYYTKSTNKQFSNGDIIISDTPPKVEYEIRHAFTVHSTQGETIKKNKLFISENKLFSKEMLYTALSRVEYLDQIVSFEILD